MKRGTHNIFGFAVSISICSSVLGLGLLYSSIVSMYFSVAINYVIDSVGGHKGYRRSPYTHSTIGVTVISILVSLPIIIAVRYLPFLVSKELQILLIALAILVGLLHIFLDMFTADGVYLLWPFKKTKFTFLKTRYDNPVLNILMIVISLLIIAGTLYSIIRPYVEKLLP